MSATSNHPSLFRIDVAEAEAAIFDGMPVFPSKRVPLDQALGGILREPVTAERDQPPFDRVTMDGIAIRFEAIEKGLRRFRLAGTQGAGEAARVLGDAGDCIEIMTGAVLPEGADTVIPVERTRSAGDYIELETGYEPGSKQCVHRQGSDHSQGQTLLQPGTRIGPTEMAILTVGGKPDVSITRQPAIAVISTGDELVDVGKPVELFQIRSSNDRAIESALQQRDFSNCTRLQLPDDPDYLTGEISRLHAGKDVLILSGGVSMGKYDYIPQILKELGVRVVLHKILQRPGLPMWFGVGKQGKPVFALPGNPVSSLVCLARYVLPALQKASGLPVPRPAVVCLTETVSVDADLACFLPVTLSHADDGRVLAAPKPTNTSGDFVSLGGTDGFVELTRSRNRFPAGGAVPFYPW